MSINERKDPSGEKQEVITQLLWSDGERVYALVGKKVSDLTLMQMANAVQ